MTATFITEFAAPDEMLATRQGPLTFRRWLETVEAPRVIRAGFPVAIQTDSESAQIALVQFRPSADEPSQKKWVAKEGAALSAQQEQVRDLVEQGLNNAEIGRKLGISREAASLYKKIVCTKLGEAATRELLATAAAKPRQLIHA